MLLQPRVSDLPGGVLASEALEKACKVQGIARHYISGDSFFQIRFVMSAHDLWELDADFITTMIGGITSMHPFGVPAPKAKLMDGGMCENRIIGNIRKAGRMFRARGKDYKLH